VLTKLILIEGLPGSGKTTTTTSLGKHLQAQGVSSRWYVEDAEPHPIDCLNFALEDLAMKMPVLWGEFAIAEAQNNGVTIIESRLWQNTAMFMYLAEYSVSEILDFHRLVWSELSPLSPLLINLHHKHVESGLRSVFSSRGEEWVNKALMPLGEYPRFQRRSQNDFTGWVAFFKDWLNVSDRLYQDWAYEKIIVNNPYDDWELTFSTILNALDLESH